MKIGDYKPQAMGAFRVGFGAGLVFAGYKIAAGDSNSYVGKMVLPKGTEAKVTWKRGLAGGFVALTGVFVGLGSLYPRK